MGTPKAPGIVLGNPVPWFRAHTVSGARVDLHVAAGRWIVLAFFDIVSAPHAQKRLAALAELAASASEDELMIYAVLAVPPAHVGTLAAMSGPSLRFIADYDGAIGEFYDAMRSPRTVVLDLMLRAVANISCDNREEHDSVLEQFLRGLPTVENSAGVPLTAPLLMVPRVFDFPLCDHLTALFDQDRRRRFRIPLRP